MRVSDAVRARQVRQQRFESSRGFDVVATVLQIRIAVQNILRSRKRGDAPARFGSASLHYVDK
jgi:hypothetical protein